MNNAEVAKVFQDIADFLELSGEVPFKVKAYQRAARSIEFLPVEVEHLMREGRLKEIPGVGEAITKKITELLTTGRLEYYEKLRAQLPEGISELLDIPGIGPKTAMRLTQELEIKSIDDLEKAIAEGKVASLYRLGDKVAENIQRHLSAMRSKERRIPIGVALPLAEELVASLQDCPGLHQISPVGSLRRFRETIGDIDLMTTAQNATEIIQAFVSLPQVKQVLVKGTTKASIIAQRNLQVDLRVVEPDTFGSLLQYFTGSKQHNINLRERGHRQGLKLSEYGITELKTGKLEKFAAEEEFYQRLGLAYIPPELREGQQEIEKAEQGAIPRLVELSDIKGDLHVHTDWSDGHNSIEAMATAAQALGYQYLAIADHSAGRGIAHGLNQERLSRQIEEIRKLDERMSNFRLLTAIEVDIRADGSLDLPEEILHQLDIVVAGVHSALGQESEKMTRRIIRAIENPCVDIIAHPSCRLLGEREPILADWEAIFQAAVQNDTALEINAMPDRLDLKDTHIFRARELGAKLVINTDSHSTQHLGYMRFGVGTARRGWAKPKDILNTKPTEELLASLKRRSADAPI
jgi:DNA polymerase (family 10)